MAFKTAPIDFLDQVPRNLDLKEQLMKQYGVQEFEVDNPVWEIMMSDYVSQLYSLIHM